jgi:hypothetical protein
MYGAIWLERQDNVKTIDGAHGRSPLAREIGKNWYVRVPDAECAAGQAFAGDGGPSGSYCRRAGAAF